MQTLIDLLAGGEEDCRVERVHLGTGQVVVDLHQRGPIVGHVGPDLRLDLVPAQATRRLDAMTARKQMQTAVLLLPKVNSVLHDAGFLDRRDQAFDARLADRAQAMTDHDLAQLDPVLLHQSRRFHGLAPLVFWCHAVR